MSDYNGWTNYATWNLPLWVENEEHTYKLKRSILDSMVRSLDADEIEDFEVCESDVKNIAEQCGFEEGKTPDHTDDEEGCSHTDINWPEIADNWTIEAKEIWTTEYHDND